MTTGERRESQGHRCISICFGSFWTQTPQLVCCGTIFRLQRHSGNFLDTFGRDLRNEMKGSDFGTQPLRFASLSTWWPHSWTMFRQVAVSLERPAISHFWRCNSEFAPLLPGLFTTKAATTTTTIATVKATPVSPTRLSSSLREII